MYGVIAVFHVLEVRTKRLKAARDKLECLGCIFLILQSVFSIRAQSRLGGLSKSNYFINPSLSRINLSLIMSLQMSYNVTGVIIGKP